MFACSLSSLTPNQPKKNDDDVGDDVGDDIGNDVGNDVGNDAFLFLFVFHILSTFFVSIYIIK